MSKNISKWTCSNTKSPTWEAPKIVFLRRFFWLFSFHQWWFFLPLFQVSCYLALFDWTCDQPFVEHTIFDFIHRSCLRFFRAIIFVVVHFGPVDACCNWCWNMLKWLCAACFLWPDTVIPINVEVADGSSVQRAFVETLGTSALELTYLLQDKRKRKLTCRKFQGNRFPNVFLSFSRTIWASWGKRHAQRLRQLNVRELVNEGKLNPEIAKMVEKLIEVAESETKVSKIGRKKELSRAQKA